MQKFKYVSHTADMAFIGYGSTIRMAISNSALALLSTMLDLKSIGKERVKESSITIKESASNKEDLVWFTLQDLLSKIDSKKINAIRFDVVSVTENEKGLKLLGKLVYKKTKKDHSLLSVKAVTPHDLTVKKQSGIYAIHVVIDV